MRRPRDSRRRMSSLELIFGAVIALMMLKLVAQQSFGVTRPVVKAEDDAQMNEDDADGGAHEDYARTEEAPFR